MAMFSPSTVHVLPFDPFHGADTARQYATKYAGKEEKFYYLETERSGVKDRGPAIKFQKPLPETAAQESCKDFLKCRTVGLCMAHNRLRLVFVQFDSSSDQASSYVLLGFAISFRALAQQPEAEFPRCASHEECAVHSSLLRA